MRVEIQRSKQLLSRTSSGAKQPLARFSKSSIVADVYMIPNNSVRIRNATVIEEQDTPVIGSNGTSIFHSSPLRPRFDTVCARVPDFLTPDNILEVERTTIVHDPLSNRLSRGSPDLLKCQQQELLEESEENHSTKHRQRECLLRLPKSTSYRWPTRNNGRWYQGKRSP